MHQGMLVRINGVLPDSKAGANTSCSVFDVKQSEVFHLLVDAGNGVADSIKQSASELGFSRTPDAILITHAHKGHTNDLPALISSQPNLKVYCTKECLDQIAKEFPPLPTILRSWQYSRVRHLAQVRFQCRRSWQTMAACQAASFMS